MQNKLDEIVSLVSGARSMPMSASCVINRSELLSMLEEVRQALPGSLAQAQELIGDRDQMVQQARQEAERIIETAHAERGSLISGTEVARRAQAEADQILGEARREAEEVRAETDDYVDSQLANFEVVLTKTIGSVGRGREKLLGTGPGLDEEGYEDEDAPERSLDPGTQRQSADEYVDVKLAAFEAVLSKTLEAVGRGRQKLQGRIATDALGDLGSLDGEGGPGRQTSDADYLAQLAAISAADEAGRPGRQDRRDPQDRQDRVQAPSQVPAAAGAGPAVPGQQDAFAYQQADQYGYQQQYGGQQQDAYGYQGSPDQYGGGYSQQGYDQQEYAQGYEQDYGAGAGQQQGYGQESYGYESQQLDETSLFDTSMISAEQLRAYEQGRGNG